MTEELIKQNAENYANKFVVRDYHEDIWLDLYDAHIAGAHSRDAEIKELQKENLYMESLLSMHRKMTGEYELKLQKLRNPWISVKDRLPEIFVDSKGITHDFSVKVLITNENNPNYWHVAEYYPDKNEWCCLEHPTYIMDNVTHWMPISELKNGE